MATPFSHVIVAGTVGLAVGPPKPPLRWWVLGALSSMLPDLDAVGFWLGVPYEHPWGHRGITHSLVFAALLGVAVVAVFFRAARWRVWRPRLWLFFFLATASHGVLDAMTNGGLGVAFFWPIDDSRYFFPFRPIEVSPISILGFFDARGLAILQNEALWVWLPSLLAAMGIGLLRRRARMRS